MARLAKDHHMIAGSTIEAPVFHIISEQECLRRFSLEKKARKFKGALKRAYPQKKSGTKRSTTYIKAEHHLETSTQRKESKFSLFKW